MDLEYVRKKFAAGKLLKRIIGEKTFSTVQGVTEYIFIKLEDHEKRLRKLEQEKQ